MGLRILVVEDDRLSQQVTGLLLRKLGYEVGLAPDGVEAVAAVTRQHYDAILMDCQMPRMDGLQATRLIRSIDGEQRTPIIAVTGAHDLDANAWRSAGIDALLHKPINRRELVDELARWIEPVAVQVA